VKLNKVARIEGLDQLKLVLALLVVTIHVFPLPLSQNAGIFYYLFPAGFARIAVPIFFMISGYFAEQKISSSYAVKAYLRNTLRLYIFWSIVYSIMWLPAAITLMPSSTRVLSYVYGFGPLWYVFALMPGAILLYLFKNSSKEVRFYSAVALFLIGLMLWILDKAGSYKSSETVNFWYALMGTSRNFLFMAFPLMTIGALYKFWERKIGIKFFIFGIICLFVEPSLYFKMHIMPNDFNIFSIVLSMSVFKFFFSKSIINGYKIDKNLPSGVYFIHYPVLFLIGFVERNLLHVAVPAITNYVYVVVISLLLYVPIRYVNKYFPFVLGK
jgi:surface polysaccharide O-acyltransferase-like enzyme